MLILVCIAIFLFSNQVGSESSQISSNLVIRKLGHFSEYLTLGFFSFAYFSNLLLKNNKCKNFKRTTLVSLIFSIFYAASDEFHQTFVDGRDGNVIDVLIDGSGAFFGMLLSGILYYTLIKKSKKILVFSCVLVVFFLEKL